jgi:hypothetical protein
LFGALLVMPAIVAANTSGYAILLRGWRRVASVVFACLAIGAAVLLEMLGVPWSAYVFGEGGMTIIPGAIELPMAPTMVFLSILAVACVLTPVLAVSRIRDNLVAAEQQLSMQAWQIHQLAPAAARVGHAEQEPKPAQRSDRRVR